MKLQTRIFARGFRRLSTVYNHSSNKHFTMLIDDRSIFFRTQYYVSRFITSRESTVFFDPESLFHFVALRAETKIIIIIYVSRAINDNIRPARRRRVGLGCRSLPVGGAAARKIWPGRGRCESRAHSVPSPGLPGRRRRSRRSRSSVDRPVPILSFMQTFYVREPVHVKKKNSLKIK